jgi:hypothetical protein
MRPAAERAIAVGGHTLLVPSDLITHDRFQVSASLHEKEEARATSHMNLKGKKRRGTRGARLAGTDVGHKGAALNGPPPRARILFEDLIADNARGTN